MSIKIEHKDLYEFLEEIKREHLIGEVSTVAITYTTKEGLVRSYYNSYDGNVFELVGAIDVLKQRATLGLIHIPELSKDERGEDE